MLNELIWNDLKCTMNKSTWEETGGEYEDLPIKLMFLGKEENVTLEIKYFEDLEEEEVCETLKNFLDNWGEIQNKILEKIFDAFQEVQDIRDESELDINCPEDMKDYIKPSMMIIQEHAVHGMCVGLGFAEEWDVHYDDYEDVGLVIVDGEVVEVGSSEVIM